MNIRFQRNVAYTQAKNVFFCLHIGSWALYVNWMSKKGHRLEILTPRRRFRWS